MPKVPDRNDVQRSRQGAAFIPTTKVGEVSILQSHWVDGASMNDKKADQMKEMSEPAFPHSRLGSDADGMTLRDYFAAKAMQGFLESFATTGIYTPSTDGLAKSSYAVADAMLKARDK